MIGQILGSYRIASQLGSGGMGAVWLGEHTLIGSPAAIKVLRPEYSENKGIVQRFFDEARAATRINHPSIVTVHDFGWQDGSAYLVMELLRGTTLTRAIDETGRIEPLRALRLMQHCAMAMGAAHAVGIVHRDLKPDNIYVVPDPLSGERVKILDFGIAKLLGDDPGTHSRTRTGMIMGTPAYMSPEQCRGAGNVDHRTDIYALGCVLFQMLTGRPPFSASTPGDLIACHLTLEPPAVSSLTTGISEKLDALTARCLAKDAGARIGSMQELGAAIDSIITAPSIVTPTPAAARSRAISTLPVQSVVGGGAAVAATTMQSGAGQSLAVPRTQRRGGMIVLALILVAAAVTVAAVAVTRKDRSVQPAAATDAAIPHLPDAAVVPDAAPSRVIIDAGSDSVTPPVRRDPPPRRDPSPPRRGSGTVRGAGSGSAYDPYDDR